MGAYSGHGDRVVAGRYALSSELGRGGMGVVWLATDRVLERTVAVKEITFPAHLSDVERGVLKERTMREARAAARLDHPCVTTVYDVVEEDDKPWLVMEHVRARSLQQIVAEQGPLPPLAVARIGLDVLAGIDAAHRAGIVHRDVKPGNVLVGANGRACLTDFGIATSTGSDSELTTQGALLGSPSYMAPERVNGGQPQPAVDLWSLGATMYTAVEGHPPFDRGEPMATMMAVVSADPAPMLRAGPLQPLLSGLLTKDPARRATTEQAGRHLESVLAGHAGGWTPPPAPTGPPAPTASPPGNTPAGTGADRGSHLQRLDVVDLHALASASKAVLGSVARDARDKAVQRARDHARPPRRRFRFKKRWVVVPVFVVIVLIVAAIIALAVLLSGAVDLS